jgi:hypothetical protein
VLSRLSGGTERGPVAGLYAGSSREVSIAGTVNGSTLLVFPAANVTSVRAGLGVAADRSFTLLALRDAASVTMGGGFWRLAGQNVVQTVRNAEGRVLSRRQLYPAPQTGPMSYTVALRAHEPVEFEKVDG